jgi:hypothetical protein
VKLTTGDFILARCTRSSNASNLACLVEYHMHDSLQGNKNTAERQPHDFMSLVLGSITAVQSRIALHVFETVAARVVN